MCHVKRIRPTHTSKVHSFAPLRQRQFFKGCGKSTVAVGTVPAQRRLRSIKKIRNGHQTGDRRPVAMDQQMMHRPSYNMQRTGKLRELRMGRCSDQSVSQVVILNKAHMC